MRLHPRAGRRLGVVPDCIKADRRRVTRWLGASQPQAHAMVLGKGLAPFRGKRLWSADALHNQYERESNAIGFASVVLFIAEYQRLGIDRCAGTKGAKQTSIDSRISGYKHYGNKSYNIRKRSPEQERSVSYPGTHPWTCR